MQISLTPEEKSLFKHIKFYDYKQATRGEFADFFVAGPQRTGTTWLTHNLKLHPEIYQTTPKELLFFNRLRLDQNKYTYSYYNLKWRWLHKDPKFFVRQVARVGYYDFIKTGNYRANQLEWYLKFFDIPEKIFRKLNHDMQTLYQEDYRPKIKGESSASYAVVDPEVIEEIVRINPDIKVILTLREPGERAWSHVKKDLMREAYRDFSEVPREKIIDFFEQDYTIRCGMYTQQIENWKAAVKEGNLFFYQHDDIQVRPVELLHEIFSFLGVTNDAKYISSKAGTVINPTKTMKIPTEYRTYLDNMFKEEKEKLADQYGIIFRSSGEPITS